MMHVGGGACKIMPNNEIGFIGPDIDVAELRNEHV